MVLMLDFMLDLDNDTKQILQVFLEDETLLRYLTIAPTSSSDNVLTITPTRPSITETKTLEQRFNEYYLGDQPTFVNWGRFPNEDIEEKGRILFYPSPIGLRDKLDRSNYMFYCLVPYSWHMKTNVAFKVVRRVVELLKKTRTFGDIGRVEFDQARPIFGIPNYVGYEITTYNYNFVR